LEVLKFLPDTPERSRQEIKLRMILGVSLMAMQGFASSEVEKVYAGGRELFWLRGPSPELFHMLWSLLLYYMWSAQLQFALDIANQLLELAEGLKEGALIMEAHRAVGGALVELGRSTEALPHLDQATALYAAHRNHRHNVFIGRDCRVLCECFAARALWVQGYPDRAGEKVAQAVALAQELGHPQTSVVAQHFAAQIHQLRGEVSLAHQRARELVTLADEYGLELWRAFGNINLGWAEIELGNSAHGIELMRRGLAAYEATGAKLWSPYFLCLLAEASANSGGVAEALKIVERALPVAESNGERYALAELYRRKGELIRISRDQKLASKTHSKDKLSPGLAEAQACFAQALSIAKQQQAKSWELRVRMSLSRLESQRNSPLHRALADAYVWFTEGYDTADLKQARVLLQIKTAHAP